MSFSKKKVLVTYPIGSELKLLLLISSSSIYDNPESQGDYFDKSLNFI